MCDWFFSTSTVTTKFSDRQLKALVIRRATHNMYAYRIYDEERGVWIQDNDDDGESAAGSRMLHLVGTASVDSP